MFFFHSAGPTTLQRTKRFFFEYARLPLVLTDLGQAATISVYGGKVTSSLMLNQWDIRIFMNRGRGKACLRSGSRMLFETYDVYSSNSTTFQTMTLILHCQKKWQEYKIKN